MSTLTVAQARSYASAAGFTGTGLNTIVAIAQAESGLNTTVDHMNSDGSIDRGILQINSRWHPEVSNAQAHDPAASFAAGYRISSNGADFHQWSTYTNGAYKQYMGGVGGIAGSGSSGQVWYRYPQTHGYITGYQGPGTDTPHYAIDFGTPQDTPFFFTEAGVIKVADYAVWNGAAGGGEIFMQPDAGGPQEYAFHLDEVDTKVGQHVAAGQLVGYTGGQNSGGKHNTDPMWSTGPHLHFGLFSNYVSTPAGQRPYGPDPSSIVAAAQTSGIGNGGGNDTLSFTSTDTTTPTPGANSITLPNGDTVTNAQAQAVITESMGDRIHTLLVDFPGFGGIALALDEAETFPGIIWYDTNGIDPVGWMANAVRSVLDTVVSNLYPAAVRGLFLIGGLFLLAGLVYKLVSDGGESEDVGSSLERAA